MEGVGELINVECKTVNELKGELAEAYKTFAEKEVMFQRLLEDKEAENQRLREEIALLKEKRHHQSEGDADDREQEVKMERKAEEIIPKECWDVVFQNLNGEDLLSCRQVCKAFKKLLDLKEFKEKWKFHQILPLLFPYLKSNDPDHRPWEHLYNARLACRSWRHWIDQYVSEVHWTSYFTIPDEPKQMPLVTSFRTFEDIEEFQERFGGCKTNPFPSRSVRILSPVGTLMPVEGEDYTQDTHNAYIEKAGYLLVQFGKHIFRLQLDLFTFHRSLGPEPLTLCKLIKKITIHLPNLKEFIIQNTSPQAAEEDMISYIAENALAPLPKLQTLSILDFWDLDQKVEDYLLDAFGLQLTQFEKPYSEYSLSQRQMQHLKNVRKLWLGLNEPSDTLENLRFLESPLQLLKLHCLLGSAQGTWHVDKLLRNLRHLPIEILDLTIIYNSDGCEGNVFEAGLDIEEYNNASIKTLIIHIKQPNPHQIFISFNFLQALTTLEKLELKFTGGQHHTTHPAKVPEVVKLNEYLFGEEGTNLLCHSNVWKKVPSLRVLELSAQEEDDDEFVKSIYTRVKTTPKYIYSPQNFVRIQAEMGHSGTWREKLGNAS